VLLLDQYLPDCKGTELAAVVRQDPRWIGLPIIFLSSEGSVEVQLTALRVGGDTFLQKPLAPEALVELVRARALRSRGFREHLFRDDLTGLYRRSYIEQRLKAEVSRAQRSGEPLAFAMLDLDQLKSVNDSYGHQVGDQVLRTLARILSERLRSSDVVSRLGGEEFGVLLPEADASRAASILNVLRARFAKKIFDGGGGRNFQVTFSCGVAEFPLCHDVEQLQIGANQALGRAKGSGRNCVVVSR
jgi:diguanylate cyclase (GGDEF)-like protein